MRPNRSVTDRQLVSQVTWLNNAEGDDIRQLLIVGRLADVDPGRVLATQAMPGREAFLLLGGEARVTIDGHLIGHLHAGDFFGELALLDHGPQAATVTADTPLRVLAFDPTSFAAAMTMRPVAREVERQLANRLRHALASNCQFGERRYETTDRLLSEPSFPVPADGSGVVIMRC